MKLEHLQKAAEYGDQLGRIEAMLAKLRDFDESNPPKSKYAMGSEPVLQLSSPYFEETAALSKEEGISLLTKRASSLRVSLSQLGVIVE